MTYSCCLLLTCCHAVCGLLVLLLLPADDDDCSLTAHGLPDYRVCRLLMTSTGVNYICLRLPSDFHFKCKHAQYLYIAFYILLTHPCGVVFSVRYNTFMWCCIFCRLKHRLLMWYVIYNQVYFL